MPVWMWWVLIGLAFLALEIPSQGFYLIWFGMGALAAGLAAGLGLGLVGQLGVFFAVSTVLLLFMRPITQRLVYKDTPHFDTNVDRMVGQIVDVIETVDNLNGTGGVRVFGADYNALSGVDGTVIEVGRKARVLTVKGSRLVVEPVDSIHPAEGKES